jgi:hypothetical protein
MHAWLVPLLGLPCLCLCILLLLDNIECSDLGKRKNAHGMFYHESWVRCSLYLALTVERTFILGVR